MLNDNFQLRNLGYSTAGDSSSLPRHRWYFFKEAFSKNIVDAAILDSGCEKDDLIVDPFGGSGTVATTASYAGRPSVSFEVNPFFRSIAEAKLEQVSKKVLGKYKSGILKAVNVGRKSPLENLSTFSEGGGHKKWLFNKDVLRAFEGGWIANEESPLPVKKIMRLALLGAAMDSCNAVRDGKCLRYRSDWKTQRNSRDGFKENLQARLKMVEEDISIPNDTFVKGRVHLGDVRKNISSKLSNKFKLSVTSPPYLNSFDYSDVYRPELFLGKFVDSNSELMKIRLRTLRSHIQASWEAPKQSDFGSLYTSTMQEIEKRRELLWAKRIPQMIQAYFEDMKKVLKALHSKALPDASLWIVVSTSAYGGVHVPVDLILAEIGAQVGWHLREVGVLRHLRCSQQHLKLVENDEADNTRLRESVVILDASPKKGSRSKKAK